MIPVPNFIAINPYQETKNKHAKVADKIAALKSVKKRGITSFLWSIPKNNKVKPHNNKATGPFVNIPNPIITPDKTAFFNREESA